jgi:hypothetical protein
MLESHNIYAMFSTNDNLVLNARVNIYRRSLPTSDKYINETLKERKFRKVETVTQ